VTLEIEAVKAETEAHGTDKVEAEATLEVEAVKTETGGYGTDKVEA
jgi:hypothetical protein